MRTFKQTAILCGSLLATTGAHATSASWDVLADPTNGFGGLTASWALNAPGSAYAAWNFFGGLTDTTPDAGSFGSAPQSVTENSGGAFVTGGGNIYSFSVPLDITAILTGAGNTAGTRDLVLKVESLGTAVDLTSVKLNGVAPTASQLLFSSALGGMGGNEEERVFVWSNIADLANYSFSFVAAGSSMSLDQLSLYASPTTVVPLPATAWLLASALGGLGVWRRHFGSANARTKQA